MKPTIAISSKIKKPSPQTEVAQAKFVWATVLLVAGSFLLFSPCLAEEAGLPHKHKSGRDEDALNEIANWQKRNIKKLIFDEGPKIEIPYLVPSPQKSLEDFQKWNASMAKLIKKFESDSNSEVKACFLLRFGEIARSIFEESDPPFGALSVENKEDLASLGVFAKQVIGENVTFDSNPDFIKKVLRDFASTHCGRLAQLKQMSMGGRVEDSCRTDQFLRIIEQGQDLLKTKKLSSTEKALVYSYLAQAYQTQWSLAFADDDNENGSDSSGFDPTDYISVHPEARANTIKYYHLLGQEVPALKKQTDYLVGRIDEKVDLGSIFFCNRD